jgi:hypothetical protein
VKVANESFEEVEKLIYSGMEVMNQTTFRKILRAN